MEYIAGEVCHERMKVLEERSARDKERLDRLETLCDAINTQNTNIERLVVELKHINKLISSQEERLQIIEAAPKSRLSQIVTAVISAVTGGIVASLFASLL